MKDWKTTVLGVGAIIVSALVFFGFLSPDQGDAINEGLVSSVENIGGLISFVVGLIALFASDSKSIPGGGVSEPTK